MRCLSFGAATVPIAVAVLISVSSGLAIAQELDCSRVYLGDLESNLRRAEVAAERTITEAQEAAGKAESAKSQLSGLEDLAREAERTLREAQAALAAAREEAERGEAEDLGPGDRGALRMAVTMAEVAVYNAEYAAEDTARDAERARRRVLFSDERVTSARQRATELEEQAQKVRGIREHSEACSDGAGSAGDGERGEGDGRNPNLLSDFAARARGVAEQAIERLKAEDERSHPDIEAEAKERLAALAESDPENALTDSMVGDSATSALAGAAWAALADEGDRLEATMAAAVPAATIVISPLP